MAHKCFTTFKTEDIWYKEYIRDTLEVDMIDKSLNVAINSEDEDYIMHKIRTEYLSDSTVTLFLIGQYSSENRGWDEQRFIKRELQASLYNGQGNSKSGILGIVLPTMTNSIYTGSGPCQTCGKNHTFVNVDNSTTISEFSYNYYIPNDKCSWSEEDRYCVLVKWEDFKLAPEFYIDKAFDKRSADISSKTKVRP